MKTEEQVKQKIEWVKANFAGLRESVIDPCDDTDVLDTANTMIASVASLTVLDWFLSEEN